MLIESISIFVGYPDGIGLCDTLLVCSDMQARIRAENHEDHSSRVIYRKSSFAHDKLTLLMFDKDRHKALVIINGLLWGPATSCTSLPRWQVLGIA